MTFPGSWNMNFGPGGMGGISRGRIQGSLSNGVNYPNPFFDVAHTYLPTTIKEMFKYCRYYFLTNGLINATVFKLAEYPVTDIIIDHENPRVKKRWEEYFHDHLLYRSYMVDTGLDYFATGNSANSLSFPFQKYLKCSACGWTERADKIREYWNFTNFSFRLNCPKCHTISEAEPKDFYYKNASGIKLLRWNVEDIEITYNDVTCKTTYFYNIPGSVRSDIVIGKKDVVENVPQIFIQALRQQKGIVFNSDNFFHLKRSTLAFQDRGWGIPIILPVLKDTFYMQLMKKSMESILLEHILPLRVLFPQSGSGSSDVFTTVNLVDWKEQVAAEIARWRLDRNYYPIFPLPIGNQTIGGDGKSLLLFQEMKLHSDQIVMGMGVPREFLEGGLSWSGSNVSMRMLENAFIGYMLRQKLMANWVMRSVAHYLDWPEAKVRFKPFKMADDIQRKAYLFQLNQAQKISDTTLLADADLDQASEDEIMLRESDRRLESTKKQQMVMAEIQGQAQMVMMKYQSKAQQAAAIAQQAPAAPGEPGGPEGAPMPEMAGAPPGSIPMGGIPTPEATMPAGVDQNLGGLPSEAQSQLGQGQRLDANGGTGVDLISLAQGYAQQIAQMPEQQQQQAIQALAAQSPELAQLVQQFVGKVGKTVGAQKPLMNASPLPEARAPRRALGSV